MGLNEVLTPSAKSFIESSSIVKMSGGSMAVSRTPEYSSWKSMIARCYSFNHKRFKDYGGRGIRVCVRWHLFELFLEDVGLKPSLDLTLERIDNDRNYEPGNVRWATSKEQRDNQRPHHRMTYNQRLNYYLDRWKSE